MIQSFKKNNTGKWCAICDKLTDEFVGAGGLNNLDHNHKKGEIGLWLLPKYWGKGIMVETMPLIIEYGFKQ